MKRTVKMATAIGFATIIIISSAFSPSKIEEKLEIPLIEFEENSSTTPSILPIKKENIEKIGSHFGMRHNPIKNIKQMHKGIDISAAEGTPIIATADGIVEEAEFNDGYGNHVKIKHDDTFQTHYAHLASMKVKKGQKVKQGDVIGIIGNTGKSLGTHLHYEVIKADDYVDPVDYFDYQIESKDHNDHSDKKH